MFSRPNFQVSIRLTLEIEVMFLRFGNKWDNKMLIDWSIVMAASWIQPIFVVFLFRKIPWSQFRKFRWKCWDEVQVLRNISKKKTFLKKIKRQEEIIGDLLRIDYTDRSQMRDQYFTNWFYSNIRQYRLTSYCCRSFRNQYKADGNMGAVFCFT